MRKIFIYLMPRIVFICLLPALLIGSDAAIVSAVILDAILVPFLVCLLMRKSQYLSFKPTRNYILATSICLLSTVVDIFTLYMGIGYAIYFVISKYVIFKEHASFKNYAQSILIYGAAQTLLFLVDILDGRLTAWYWDLQPYCVLFVIVSTSVVDIIRYIIGKFKSKKHN